MRRDRVEVKSENWSAGLRLWQVFSLGCELLACNKLAVVHYCILHTAHCTLHIAHCTLHTAVHTDTVQ